jgi:hypothetical protein
MKQGISEIVGEAFGTGQSTVTIYRALKELLCAACGEPIKEGMLFTRRSLDGQGLRILSQCRKCMPFNLHSADEKERRPSALLESLLTPQPEPSEVQVRNPGAEREAVERRLGPALRRCRLRPRS